MANYTQIKHSLEQLYSLLDTVEKNSGKPNGINSSLRDMFKMDLHTFFMYLSAADGKISSEERNFMNYLFDSNMSGQDYVKFINENNIYSTDFEERTPVTLQVLTNFDKKAQLLAGIVGKSLDPITPMFVKFYAEVGKVFVACDGVDQNELQELQNYINGVVERISAKMQEGIPQNKNDDVAFVGGKKGASASTSAASSNIKKYGPSVYKVGVDIPAGEYKLYPDGGRGYFGICKDANCDQIIRNDNFSGQAYIIISNGQFLDLTRCYAIPADKAPLYKANGVYEPGEYKVGIEIPAGEYRIMATGGARGYYGIEVPLSNGERQIISNGNFQNAAYVSVKDGQILQLTRCSIRL